MKRCCSETEAVFSGLIVRKAKKNIHEDALDTNARLKNFCSQKALITSITLTLTKTTWVSKIFTLTRKVIQCLHKTLSGITI